jgi:hypothetical protein
MQNDNIFLSNKYIELNELQDEKKQEIISNSNSMLILDNIDKDYYNDKTFQQICFNGLCYRINTMVIISSVFKIDPPCLRYRFNYIFLFNYNNIEVRRKLYEYYGGMFPTFDIFCQIFDNYTKHSNCLVIDNITRSDKFEDKIYLYECI